MIFWICWVNKIWIQLVFQKHKRPCEAGSDTSGTGKCCAETVENNLPEVGSHSFSGGKISLNLEGWVKWGETKRRAEGRALEVWRQ